MAATIKIKRGLEGNRLSIVPAEGELLYTTDEKKVYIGDGSTSGGNAIGGGGSLASLDKSFVADEEYTITLSDNVVAPSIAVTKEVPQLGFTNNTWDVSGSNYEIEDFALDTNLDVIAGYGYENISSSGTITAPTSSIRDISVQNNGTKLYIAQGSTTFYQYNLTIPYDLSTAVSAGTTTLNSYPSGVVFKPDGMSFITSCGGNSNIYQYNLSQAWDVTTIISTKIFSSPASMDGIGINPEGTRLILVDGATIYGYNLTTAWDVSTASNQQSNTITTALGMYVSPYGDIIIGDNTNDSYIRYSTATPFDVSSLSVKQTINVSGIISTPYGVHITDNGKYMYFVDNSSTLYKYAILKNQLTLSSGSFTSDMVGMTIKGNGGEAVLTATSGTYLSVVPFSNTNAIASGSWTMQALKQSTSGVSVSKKEYGLTNSNQTQILNTGYNNRDSVVMPIANGYYILAYSSSTNSNALWVECYDSGNVRQWQYSSGSSDVLYIQLDYDFVNNRVMVYCRDVTANKLASVILNNLYTSYSVFRAYTTYTLVGGSIVTGGAYLLPNNGIVVGRGSAIDVVTVGGDATSYTVADVYAASNSVYNSLLKVDAMTYIYTSHYYGENKLRIAKFTINSTYTGFENTLVADFTVNVGTSVSDLSADYDPISKNLFITVTEVTLYDTYYMVYNIGTTITNVKASTLLDNNNTMGYNPWKKCSVTFIPSISRFVVQHGLAYIKSFDTSGNNMISLGNGISTVSGRRERLRTYDGVYFYEAYRGTSDYAYVSKVQLVASVSQYNKHLPSVSPQINTTFWSDLNSITATETLNGQTVNYALSADNRMTWKVAKTGSGVRNIVKNDNGTWKYNTAIVEVASDLLTSGTSSRATASASYGGNEPYRAFDGIASYSSFYYGSYSANMWLKYDNIVSSRMVRYVMTCTTLDSPNSWTLQGSDTGVFSGEQETISTVTAQTGWVATTPRTFTVSASKPYRYYRFVFTAYNQGSNYAIGIYDVSFVFEGYTTNETWTNATTNTELKALSEAMSISQNNMPSSQLQALTDSEQIVLGDKLNLAQILYTNSASATPIADGVTINYDANAKNEYAVLGVDYKAEQPATDKIVIKSLANNNLKVRIV